MPRKTAAPAPPSRAPSPPPPPSSGSIPISVENSSVEESLAPMTGGSGSVPPTSAGSGSAPPMSARSGSYARSGSVPPASGGASSSAPPPNSAASSFVPSTSFQMVVFNDIKPGMVVQTSGCRYPAELVKILGLPEDDHISDGAPQSAKHWVLVVDTITDHKHGRKKVLLCANVTTLHGAGSLEESAIPAAWREFFIHVDADGEAGDSVLVPNDGWPGAPCWIITVASMQLVNRTDSFRVVDGGVMFDENSVRRVRDTMFHNEKSGLMAALLDPENEIHQTKDEAPAEEAPAKEAPTEEYPSPKKKAKVSFEDVMPGMIVRAQHARFPEELCEQLGVPLDDPICKAKADNADHEEMTHEVLVLHKGRDAPTGKQVVIGLNITRLGGVKTIEESSVPAPWRKYFIKIDPEGNPENGDLVPIGGWKDGPCWAITVKTAEVITGEGKEYKTLEGAIVKFDEATVRALLDTAIVNEKDRIAAAIIDGGSWLRTLIDNAPASEHEPKPAPEPEAASAPPPASAPRSEIESEASEPPKPPPKKRTVRTRKVSIVTDESEVSHDI